MILTKVILKFKGNLIINQIKEPNRRKADNLSTEDK